MPVCLSVFQTASDDVCLLICLSVSLSVSDGFALRWSLFSPRCIPHFSILIPPTTLLSFFSFSFLAFYLSLFLSFFLSFFFSFFFSFFLSFFLFPLSLYLFTYHKLRILTCTRLNSHALAYTCMHWSALTSVCFCSVQKYSCRSCKVETGRKKKHNYWVELPLAFCSIIFRRVLASL